MKALLRKDLYVLISQFKMLFVVLLILTVIPDGRFIPFSILYSVILTSISLMSLDESCRWETLALMLPFSRRQIVAERYVSGWMSLAFTILLATAFQLLWAVTGVTEWLGAEYFSALCVYISAALVMQSVFMPVSYRFGFMKARIINIFITGAAAGGIGLIVGSGGKNAFTFVLRFASRLHPALFLLISAALCAATIPLSVKGFEKRTEK